MTIEDVYQFYGGIIKAANAVNVSRQTFHTWMRRGIIPLQQQARYEKLSKKKLKAHNPEITQAEKSDFYFPRFRYYSNLLGMCDVHSLTYLSDRSPRILFYHPENRKLKLASFQVENLMQASCFEDMTGKILYVNDIFTMGAEEVIFDSFYGPYLLDILIDDARTAPLSGRKSKMLIIGNIFEGKKL